MARKRKAPSPTLAKEEPKLEELDSDEESEEEEEAAAETSSEENNSSSSSSEEEAEKDMGEEESSSSESEEDDVTKRENIRNLLLPFGKDQLIEILKQAASADPSIRQRLLSSVDSDPVHRKIFVHGLGWDTTNETLISAFKPFGEVEECRVVMDKVSGKSKGYGFVMFKTRKGANKALKQPQKKIGSRMTACQLAAAGPIANPPPASVKTDSSVSRKLYVANVAPHIGKDKLLGFFRKFGEVEEGPLGLDKNTGKFKGFAIFVYKTAEGIKKALEEPVKVFQGLKLQCSVAIEGRGTGGKNNQSNAAVGNAGMGPVFPTGNVGIPNLQLGGLGPAAIFLGQNPALGMMNPYLGMGGSLNQMGFAPPMMGGLAQGVNGGGGGAGGVAQGVNGGGGGAAPPMGFSAGFGGQQSVNTISPSVISTFGSQAALQRVGSYQGAPAPGSGMPHSSV